jgi:hypothetical protein
MNMRKIRELNKKIRENINLIDESSEDTSFVEKRSGAKDRRNVHTFLADDRRCGIADRRKRTITARYHDPIFNKT